MKSLWALALFCMLGLPAFRAHAQIVQNGGSNYVAIDLDPGKLTSPAGWRDNAVFRSPSCATLGNEGAVRRDLVSMYRGGQRKLAVVVWYAHLRQPGPCHGYLVNVASTQAAHVVQDNLIQLARIAGSAGFDELQIRFAPQWLDDPVTWRGWDEALFQDDLTLIEGVIRSVRPSAGLRIKYDLGVELGGITRTPFVADYVKRLWRAAEPLTGPDGSYGFSIPFAAGRLTREIAWLREAGPLPTEFALDIYDHPARLLSLAAREAQQGGIAHPVFIIQETYYGEADERTQLAAAAREAGATIRTVMQWPKTASSPARISESTTPSYVYRAD